MAKTLISRLDAENIVRAAVDPDTHEATGDVYDSVNDVSYPFGGGSGTSLKNPVVKITFTGDSPIRIWDILYIDNDELYNKIAMTGLSLTVDALAVLVDNETGYMTAPQLEDAGSVTESDLVNCTYSFGEIYVTDPTADASITLTYVTGGGE